MENNQCYYKPIIKEPLKTKRLKAQRQAMLADSINKKNPALKIFNIIQLFSPKCVKNV